jgi:hypothetical protein
MLVSAFENLHDLLIRKENESVPVPNTVLARIPAMENQVMRRWSDE